MIDNRISFELTPEKATQIGDALALLRSTLLPILVTLTTTERQEMARMGDKTFPFVVKALEYCKQEPQLYANFVDVSEFDKDVTGYATLRGLYTQLEVITSALDDSLMLSGSEAYNAALVAYSILKNAARTHQPGAKEKVVELANRFPRGKHKPNDTKTNLNP